MAAQYTARRENERLIFEKDRAKRQEKIDQDRMFLNERREAFAGLMTSLRLAGEEREQLLRLRLQHGQGGPYVLEAVAVFSANYPSWNARHHEMLSLISLIAPKVEPFAVYATGYVEELVKLMRSAELTTDQVDAAMSVYRRSYFDCRLVMQINLGLPGLEKNVAEKASKIKLPTTGTNNPPAPQTSPQAQP